MIGDIWTGLASALGAADKVFDLINREPEIMPGSGSECPEFSILFAACQASGWDNGTPCSLLRCLFFVAYWFARTVKIPNFEGHIRFKDVTFEYPARPGVTVLSNVSFEAGPNEVVALVGPSGGGKSSCIKLLQRLYEPKTGCVW